MAAKTASFLVRDHREHSWLNLQHYLWIKLFGYLLHPDVPTDNKNLRVADIGTGTGTWLVDLAEVLPPSVHLDGFDITLDGTPPPKWLPSNMTFQHWDVRSEPAREWIGTYDVVHIRLFAFVLEPREVQSVISRLKKLLKPGGYLQWGEIDMSSWKIEKTHPANKVDALTELLQLGNKENGGIKWSFCPQLPDLFEREGFENVVQDVRNTPPHLLLPMHESHLLHMGLWVQKHMSGTAEGARKEAMLQQAERETSQGSVWTFTQWTVVGRKPFMDIDEERPVTTPDTRAAHPSGHLFFLY